MAEVSSELKRSIKAIRRFGAGQGCDGVYRSDCRAVVEHIDALESELAEVRKEIAGLKAENARLSLTTGAIGDQLAAGLLGRLMSEIERLKAAGKVLEKSLESVGPLASDDECNAAEVFEEASND